MNAPTYPVLCMAFSGSHRVVVGVGASALLLGFALLAPVYGQSSGGLYTLNAYTVAAGGGRATGGIYALEGSIGQHDASNPLTGGIFELTGGFHRRAPSAPVGDLFQNGFE